MKKLLLVLLLGVLFTGYAAAQNTTLIVETTTGEPASLYLITSRLSSDPSIYSTMQVGMVPGTYNLENGYYEFEVGIPYGMQFDVYAQGGTQHWEISPTNWFGVIGGIGLIMGTGIGGAFTLDLVEEMTTFWIVFGIGSAIGIPLTIASFGTARRL
ncbi:MAG: hypothetical protein ACLFR1_10725 [Spirochaetia bacterium]